MKTTKYLISLIAIVVTLPGFSQVVTGQAYVKPNSRAAPVDSASQKDLIDIVQKLLDKTTDPNKRKTSGKANLSIIPYAGYTLSTGFTADISGNIGFYTSTDHQENYSIFAADVGYDSKSQKILLTRSEIWANKNSFKIVTDLRLEQYPTETYGLGTFTTFATDNHISFYYARVYETVLKRLASDFYGGIGYNLDYHYDITASGNANGTVSDFTKYGQPPSSSSSGVNITFLFDNRKNPLNPLTGLYANAIYRDNLAALGSSANWQEIQLDVRKYIKVSATSNNVLALWSIVAFTNGNVPYLDLPATSSDMYNNSGRGYAVGRFRGRNMLYLESEYRFGITHNGLLGAVIFANAQSFSEFQTNKFETVAPAAGTGIRIKINKHSDTNICVDYGVGTNGSHGFFVNLGELF